MKKILLRLYGVILFFACIIFGMTLMFIGAIIIGAEKTSNIQDKIGKHLDSCFD